MLNRCLLFIVASFVIFSNSSAQNLEDSCSTHYFTKSINHIGYIYTPKLTMLPGGDVLATCFRGNTFNAAKINSRGDTIWNKLYDVPNSWGILHHKTLIDLDGNILLAVNEDNFIKIDTSGNFLSGKKIQNTRNLAVRDIVMMNNGDKIILFTDNVSGGAILARFDTDLNELKWSKLLLFYSTQFTNILIDKDKIIIGGASVGVRNASNKHSFIGKIDAFTGKLVQFRYYKAENSFSSIQNLYQYDNGYIASCYLVNESVESGKNGYIRFDKDLNILSARRIKEHSFTFHTNWGFHYLPQPNGSFYLAFGASWSLSLSLIGKNDSIKWVKDIPGLYSYPSDIKQYRDDALYMTGNQNVFYVGIGVYGAESYIVKSDLNGKVGSCQTEQYPTLQTENYNFSEGVGTLNETDVSLSINPTSVSISNYSPNISTRCSFVSICETLKLKGNTFTCTTDPLYITGIRNIGCTNPILWTVIPAINADIQNYNDSMASLTFSKSGVYTIMGTISRQCGENIKDSMLIYVNLSTNLNVGKDTVLCTGNTLLLRAGNQFNSYKWQDGSTDSIFNVTGAGKYYVTATDFCNNIYSDTINVSETSSYTFSVGNDTSKCNQDSITIKAPDGFKNYTWGPDYNIHFRTTQTIKVFPVISTSYHVRAETKEGCHVFDTIQVTVHHSPAIFLGADTTLCYDQKLLLNAGNQFTNYTWSTGSQSSSIDVNAPGTYSVVATNMNLCLSSDTIEIKKFQFTRPYLGNDTSICSNTGLRLFPGNYTSYAWNTGEINSNNVTVNTSGQYWVEVTDANNCSGSDTIDVREVYQSPANFLPDRQEICFGDAAVLKTSRPFTNYQWSTGARISNISVHEIGLYQLSVTDQNGCTGTESTLVAPKQDCPVNIYFYDAFTPNQDGLNDHFKPIVKGRTTKYSFTIYDRFGQIVFSSMDPNIGWDGNLKGELSPKGMYIFICTYQFPGFPESFQKGNFVLIR